MNKRLTYMAAATVMLAGIAASNQSEASLVGTTLHCSAVLSDTDPTFNLFEWHRGKSNPDQPNVTVGDGIECGSEILWLLTTDFVETDESVGLEIDLSWTFPSLDFGPTTFPLGPIVFEFTGFDWGDQDSEIVGFGLIESTFERVEFVEFTADPLSFTLTDEELEQGESLAASFDIQVEQVSAPVPVPPSVAFALTGLALLGYVGGRQNRARSV